MKVRINITLLRKWHINTAKERVITGKQMTMNTSFQEIIFTYKININFYKN